MDNDCVFCRVNENPDQKMICGNGTVLSLQKAREQGALLGSGVFVPVRHAETLFDLMREGVCATFKLLKQVKWWTDKTFHPDGYNVGWNCGAVGDSETCTPTCTSFYVFGRSHMQALVKTT